MKPLDFVKTPKGNIAIVKEINEQKEAAIEFIGDQNPQQERNAWWDGKELEVIDSLPSLLSRNLAHPFGSGRWTALEIYPYKEKV